MFTRVAIENILRDVIDEDMILRKETIDWVNECAVAFIQQLGDASNKIAEDKSATEYYRITAQDVLEGLKQLGMGRYMESIQELEAARPPASKKKTKTKKKNMNGLSHEELVAEQNELIRKASEKAIREGW